MSYWRFSQSPPSSAEFLAEVGRKHGPKNFYNQPNSLTEARPVDDELPVRPIPHDPKDEAVTQIASGLLSYGYEKALYCAIMNGLLTEEAIRRALDEIGD
jgi:hypothetical protein